MLRRKNHMSPKERHFATFYRKVFYVLKHFLYFFDNFDKIYLRKMKRIDPVLWKKALTPTEKSKKQSDKTKTPPKTSIKPCNRLCVSIFKISKFSTIFRLELFKMVIINLRISFYFLLDLKMYPSVWKYVCIKQYFDRVHLITLLLQRAGRLTPCKAV